MFVVTNTFQPAFTGISSFFFVLDPRITLEEGLACFGWPWQILETSMLLIRFTTYFAVTWSYALRKAVNLMSSFSGCMAGRTEVDGQQGHFSGRRGARPLCISCSVARRR
jgi:hypothetical protein